MCHFLFERRLLTYLCNGKGYSGIAQRSTPQIKHLKRRIITTGTSRHISIAVALHVSMMKNAAAQSERNYTQLARTGSPENRQQASSTTRRSTGTTQLCEDEDIRGSSSTTTWTLRPARMRRKKARENSNVFQSIPAGSWNTRNTLLIPVGFCQSNDQTEIRWPFRFQNAPIERTLSYKHLKQKDKLVVYSMHQCQHVAKSYLDRRLSHLPLVKMKCAICHRRWHYTSLH